MKCIKPEQHEGVLLSNPPQYRCKRRGCNNHWFVGDPIPDCQIGQTYCSHPRFVRNHHTDEFNCYECGIEISKTSSAHLATPSALAAAKAIGGRSTMIEPMDDGVAMFNGTHDPMSIISIQAMIEGIVPDMPVHLINKLSLAISQRFQDYERKYFQKEKSPGEEKNRD